MCFDSILVRLKVTYGKSLSSTIPFRFHTGSIKRGSSAYPPKVRQRFRFHTGSIKSVAKQIQEKSSLQKFRFHTGSIKSQVIFNDRLDMVMFRFHTGSIKRVVVLRVNQDC